MTCIQNGDRWLFGFPDAEHLDHRGNFERNSSLSYKEISGPWVPEAPCSSSSFLANGICSGVMDFTWGCGSLGSTFHPLSSSTSNHMPRTSRLERLVEF